MGYHAPDAEDVYRYIFRLDRHSEAGLSDGFGWSILFVNDSSPACREFLLRYGAELCHRTADRIRFVFFSGLDTTDTQDLAAQANNSRGGGFLSRIISAAAEWASPPQAVRLGTGPMGQVPARRFSTAGFRRTTRSPFEYGVRDLFRNVRIQGDFEIRPEARNRPFCSVLHNVL